MADQEVANLPVPSAEEFRIAARDFEYANRATVGGNFDIAIQCLRTSCKLVPANLSYRQALRKVEKTKYKNNLRGSLLAPLTTLASKARLRRALLAHDYRRALEHGEAVLARNPWDKGAHLHMAEAAAALGMPLVAIWLLQQAREKNGKDVQINRALARLLEKEGHFIQAIHLWELVRKADPTDTEAQDKAKQLAATETIARGNYEEVTAEVAALAPEGGKKTKTPPPATKKVPGAKKQAPGEEEALRARLEENTTNPEHYLQLAGLHRRNGRLEEARSILQQGLEALGEASELKLALADLEIEPLRQALARAEEQARAQPQDEALQKARNKLVAQVNARELVLFRQKVDRDPADRNNRFELGVRLLRAEQVEEAICELQAARADARLTWKALLHLGHCFKARHNWPLARRNFEEALRNMPSSEEGPRKELLFHLAQGHADAGDLERAIELALDLANLDYAYGNIGRLLEEWQARQQGSASVKSRGK